MSELSNVLLVKPGKYVKCGDGEVNTSKGHKCPRCDGRGYFISEIGREEYEKTLCSTCKGVGRLKAIIVTKWMPDDEPNG